MDRRDFLKILSAVPVIGPIINRGIQPVIGEKVVDHPRPLEGIMIGEDSGTYPFRDGEKVFLIAPFGWEAEKIVRYGYYSERVKYWVDWGWVVKNINGEQREIHKSRIKVL